MKKSFTLIELIFVIVIIGFLAVVALPKFSHLTSHAKEASIKSVVNSVQDSIENLHAKWLVNEDFIWEGADGNNHSSDWNDSTGYPKKLDSGSGTNKLFSYVLKIPINSCGNNGVNCWEEYEDNKYEYNYSSTKSLRIEYNQTNGTMECIDGVGVTQGKCESIIY